MEAKRQEEKMNIDTEENKYCIPSTEEGFTGSPETWFDGKFNIVLTNCS